ncbi:MAG: hypothetical protein ISS33_00040 [Candidatus Omnitrophica bacterium]|nr:hypothetical protein [Candidatus Omnitrophota bacterium]
MKSNFKQSTFCKTISLFLVLAFSFSNTTFAAERFSVVPESTQDTLSTALKFGFGSRIVLDKDVEKNLKEWFKDISKDGVLDKIREATGKCVESYLDGMKKEMIPSFESEKEAHSEWMKLVENDKDWETIFTDFLGKYEKNLGKENIPNEIRTRVKVEFDKFRIRARGKAGLPTRSAGEWYARTGANRNKPLTREEHGRLNLAITLTIEDLKRQISVSFRTNGKAKIQEEFMKMYGRRDNATGGYFIVLPDELYEKYIESTGAPSDIECHPGTRETRKQYEKYGSLESVEEYYYMRESSYDRLTESEKIVLAQHEDIHTRIALGLIALTSDAIAAFGFKSEEEWVNNQQGSDIRPIMARLSALRKQEKKFEDIFRRNEEIIAQTIVVDDGSLEGYYEMAKVFGKHTPFTVEQFATLISKKPDDAEEILEELWLKNKKINHVKGFNNEVWYQWDPIGPVTIVTPDMTPDDIPVGAPMLVAIGHSEVRDYLNMGIVAIRAQRDLFQKAAYRIVGPWGDFMTDKEYHERGLRFFPVTPDEIALKKNLTNDEDMKAVWALSHEVDAVQKIDEIEGIKTHKEYGAYYGILKPLLEAEFKKLVDDVTKEAAENNETPDIIGAIEDKYASFLEYDLRWNDLSTQKIIDQQGTIAKTIEVILNNLDEVKRRIIEEISTVYEINYQIKILFENVPIETVLYQFINPYEPVKAIRGASLHEKVAKFRLEKQIPVFLELGVPSEMEITQAENIATLFGYVFKDKDAWKGDWWNNMIEDLREEYRKRLKISYGGGTKADIIEGMVEVAGYNGAFVARYIYTLANAVKLAETAAGVKDGLDLLYNFKANEKGPWMPWIQGYEDAGVDLEKVNIFHCISRLHIDAALRELRGEDVSELFRDATTDEKKKIITIDGREDNIATRGTGSNTGIIPAEFLASAGVTHAVIDPTAVSAPRQIANMEKAGIQAIIPEYEYRSTNVSNLKTKLDDDLAKTIQIISDRKHMPAITPINEVMAVHAEMTANESEPQKAAPLARQKGYYEDVEEPEGIDATITETIKNGAPFYLDLEGDIDACNLESPDAPKTITLSKLKSALKYFPEELLGKDAIRENGIVFPEMGVKELQEKDSVELNILVKSAYRMDRIIMAQSDGKNVLSLGEEPEESTHGLHILAVKTGSATISVTDARGDIKTAKIVSLAKGGFLLVIPASAKSVSVETLEQEAEILDIFVPALKRKIPIAKPFKQGKKIGGTNIVASEERGVIKDYGLKSEEVDVITINGEKKRPPKRITHGGVQRPHRLVVKSGAVEIEINNNNLLVDKDEKIVVFGPGEVIDVNMDIREDGDSIEGRLIIESPDGRKFHFRKPPTVREINDYWIKKTLHSETVIVEASYANTEGEQAVYNVYEMLEKHASLVKKNKIDLIVPKEMFSDSLSGDGSKEKTQRNLDKLFGKGAVKIKEYNSEAGLDQQSVVNLLSSSLSSKSPEDVRIPVLFATESNITAIQPESDFDMPEKLEDILKQTRILSLPDIEGLSGKGWLYASTALRIGILQGCLTPKDVQKAENGEQTLAQDIKKLMRAVTHSQDIDIKDLYLMLSYNEIPTGQRRMLQIGAAVTLMRLVLETLLLGIPMERIDRSDWKDCIDQIDSSL